jgi:flagellar capping protein FliD
MSPTEQHNWEVTKRTLETMQAETRELRAQLNEQDSKLLELQNQLRAQQKATNLLQARLK